jgi:hypothetical protein
LAEKVDSSHVDRNETDQARRKVIHSDEVEYKARKARAEEWTAVISGLDSIGDKGHIHEKIISNIILEEWWDVRFFLGSRPVYLAYEDIQGLVEDILSESYEPSKSFKDSAFGGLYRSIALKDNLKMASFFLERGCVSYPQQNENPMDDRPNHFFAVVFDYETQTAYSFGLELGTLQEPVVRVESGEASGWAQWLGPSLWKAIAYEMGWGDALQNLETVKAVTKIWPQVCEASPTGRKD